MAPHKTHGKTWIIYGIRRRGDATIRYVGQTSRGLGERLRGHLNACHSEELQQWLVELATAGESPEAIPLATAKSRKEATVIERDWIKSLSFVFGDQLFNYHHRGDFVLLWDLEQAALEVGHELRTERISRNREARRIAYENRRIVATYSHDGHTLTLREWAKRLGVSRQRVHQRIQWCERTNRPISEALSTPSGGQMPSARPGGRPHSRGAK
jgi:hypothetical protein